MEDRIVISEKSISHLLELVMDLQHDLTRAETKIETLERYYHNNTYYLKPEVVRDILGVDELTREEMDEINKKMADVPY